MSLDALIMLAGVIVAALPFLGFPHAWLQWLMFAIGVCVIALGIVTRRRLSHIARRPESGPIQEAEAEYGHE